MKRLQTLLTEITTLTLKIEQEYPELYKHLDETPITIPSPQHPKMDTKNFSDYLDSLKALLQHHLENKVIKKDN